MTETHALAAANQQKNDRLREAFGISSDYVDGSSFHPDRKEREKEKREQERLEREKLQQQKYQWVDGGEIEGSYEESLFPLSSEIKELDVLQNFDVLYLIWVLTFCSVFLSSFYFRIIESDNSDSSPERKKSRKKKKKNKNRER